MIKTKAAYDNAVEALQKLLDKRDARKDELWKAVINNSQSYEEIFELISDTVEEQQATKV